MCAEVPNPHDPVVTPLPALYQVPQQDISMPSPSVPGKPSVVLSSRVVQLASLSTMLTTPPPSSGCTVPASAIHAPASSHKGKAPTFDTISEENPEMGVDDWVPSHQLASTWNGSTEEEELSRLVDSLRGHALRVWTLLSDTNHTSMKSGSLT